MENQNNVNNQEKDKYVFWIWEAITKESVKEIIERIDKIINEDILINKNLSNAEEIFKQTPIELHISTPGGDVDATFALIHKLDQSLRSIITYNEGQVMSAGILIYLAGDKRFVIDKVLKNFLIHDICYGNFGKIENHDYQLNDAKEVSDYLFKFIANRSNLSVEVIKERLNTSINKDWFINGDEALKFGLATDFITSKNYWKEEK